MTYTKVDNKILELMATADPKEVVLYIAILSVKREGYPLHITNGELVNISGIGKNKITTCLKTLEEKGLITFEGKAITEVAHQTNGLNANYTMIDNDLLAAKIDARAKMMYVKIVSLKPDAFGYVKIGQERLAECVRLQDRTSIHRHTKRLKETGWIVDVREGDDYNECNYYKVKRVDQCASAEALRQEKTDKQKEKYRLLQEKVGTGRRLSADELWEWFRCLVIENGNHYNVNNKSKDKGVLRHLLTMVESNLLAHLIKKYVDVFDRRFQNYEHRRTIKLHFLGSDDVINMVKRMWDNEENREVEYAGDETGEFEVF